jgi:alpha-tubulin suppressor-like RCC1 family protein
VSAGAARTGRWAAVVVAATACGGSPNGSTGRASVAPPSSVDSPAAAPAAAAHIAAGDYHTCALRGDGAVRCWGRNAEGQLGEGTSENRTMPVLVQGVTGATRLALGSNSSCAVMRDRTVSCWGAGKAWGDGQKRSNVAPTQVAGVSDVVQLDAGGLLMCAVTSSGKVKCWGDEGNPTPAGASAPPDSNAMLVSAGEAHACARLNDGSVRCWGDSPWNGVGGPSLAHPKLAGAVQVTTGDAMACVLLQVSTGPVLCWGRNDQGELGRAPDNDWHTDPGQVPLHQVTSVTAGEAHVCAIEADRTVVCWGSNSDGELGRGTQSTSERPGAVPGLTDVQELALGADHACALDSHGVVWCWGSNAFGQLGDGTTERRTAPARVAW